MGQKKGGRGRAGGGRRHFVQNEDDLKKRNENQERYQATRRARRQEGEESGSEDEDVEEFDEASEEISEQMAAMRAGLQGNAEGDEASGKKKKGAAGVIETANPNAANASQKHKKASALDGSQPKVELTRREREEIEKQRAAAAYAKKHAEGKTEEAQRDMERLKEAKKRREEAAAKAKKVDADAERQKAMLEMEKAANAEAKKAASFFEKDQGGDDEDVEMPKLETRKVKSMKPAQLKEELKMRGLSTQGNAKELLKRVLETCC